MSEKADICLFLEGTYPYFRGGVATWTDELIKSQKELTFSIVTILPPEGSYVVRYELPKNVISRSDLILQKLPEKARGLSKTKREELFRSLEPLLLELTDTPSIDTLKSLLRLIDKYQGAIDTELLLESKEAWNMMVRIYLTTMGSTSFLNFFWSFRSLIGGLFSILLCPLPEAAVYHTFCTGFAGLLLAKAFAETGRPCLTTEHGIYTNERRIEIASASWLDDRHSQNFSIKPRQYDRDVKDFWTETFLAYSKLCYQASTKIITLYSGNQLFQIADGADPSKLQIVPNGVDYEKFSQVIKDKNHPPTVALIGRVVPIKDIKTFIRAIEQLSHAIKEFRAYILGPTNEEPEYTEECIDLIDKSGLNSRITLTGNVDIMEYLPIIDVVVLTSLSEGQPLTLLEAGAAGIPCVATNVGACPEFAYGSRELENDEGIAGIITPLANPTATSKAIEKLLTEKPFYERCCEMARQRVKNHYNKKKQTATYREIYREALNGVCKNKLND